MKITFFAIIGLVMLSLPYINAQTANDNSVTVIAKWHEHETHLYEYTQHKLVISDGDTTMTTEFSRKFTIEVNDSSQHFYLLKYHPADTLPQQHLAIDSIPLELMTNHNGALIKVLNWDNYMALFQDIQVASDAIFPFAALVSYNGKSLKLDYKYQGAELVSGDKIGVSTDSIIAHTKMIASREFSGADAEALITVNTTTKYTLHDNPKPIGVTDYFKQVIDCSKGWAIATYIAREFTDETYSIIETKSIQLLD